MSINILTFICGVGVGLCLAFLLRAALHAHRVASAAEQHRWHQHPYGEKSPSERWREAQHGKRNDEPTELDQ